MIVFMLSIAAYALFLGLVVYAYVFRADLRDFFEYTKGVFLPGKLSADRRGSNAGQHGFFARFRVSKRVKRSDLSRDELRAKRRSGGFMVGKENKFSPSIVVGVLLIVLVGGWWLKGLADMGSKGHTSYRDKIPVVTLVAPVEFSTAVPTVLPTVLPPFGGAGSP